LNRAFGLTIEGPVVWRALTLQDGTGTIL